MSSERHVSRVASGTMETENGQKTGESATPARISSRLSSRPYSRWHQRERAGSAKQHVCGSLGGACWGVNTSCAAPRTSSSFDLDVADEACPPGGVLEARVVDTRRPCRPCRSCTGCRRMRRCRQAKWCGGSSSRTGSGHRRMRPSRAIEITLSFHSATPRLLTPQQATSPAHARSAVGAVGDDRCPPHGQVPASDSWP
jgi:hypothetical protein